MNAAAQQQQQQPGASAASTGHPSSAMGGGPGTTMEYGGDVVIREIWQGNLEQEFNLLRTFIDHYPYVAMDTEFPGVVARPVGVSFNSQREYLYKTIKANVDMLKLIQLGLTLTDSRGRLPCVMNDRTGLPERYIWQVNFREFSPTRDMQASESIELLRESGINFESNMRNGVDVKRFAELLMVSGIILNEDVRWITFHSTYDFGYLVKLVTCEPLPEEEADFMNLISMYFPHIYDMKYLMRFCENLHGGLNKIADVMSVQRVGTEHQAGSDSLLTSATFFKMRDMFFSGKKSGASGAKAGVAVAASANSDNVGSKDGGGSARAANASASGVGGDGDGDAGVGGHRSISMHGLDDQHDMRFLKQHMGIIFGLNEKEEAGAGAGAAAGAAGGLDVDAVVDAAADGGSSHATSKK